MTSHDAPRTPNPEDPAHTPDHSGTHDQDPATQPSPGPADAATAAAADRPPALVPKAGFVTRRLTNQQPALLALKTNVAIFDDICDQSPRFENFLKSAWSTLVALATLAVTLAFATSAVADAGDTVGQTVGATATNWETWLFAAIVPGAAAHARRRLKR